MYIKWFSLSYLRLIHLQPFPVCSLPTEIQIWVRLAQKILKQQRAAEYFLHLMLHGGGSTVHVFHFKKSASEFFISWSSASAAKSESETDILKL